MEKTLSFHIHPGTLDFDLPKELIAQEPFQKRDEAQFLVVDRTSRNISHQKFFEVKNFLKAGDVLVVNKARVSHSRLYGKKETGGSVEVLLIEPESGPTRWKALVKPMLKEGTRIIFTGNSSATLVGRTQVGENILEFSGGDPASLMRDQGEIPLPPYIKREKQDARYSTDRVFYQTVYAETPGSIAAPTAGLHFTEELLSDLRASGVEVLSILLHVGWGTFRPIAASIADHVMLPEKYEIDANVWGRLKEARRQGRRIVAVGTTVTRVLESLTGEEPEGDVAGATSLFIKPGFTFRWVEALITNLHVPMSTPISLVSAFAGLDLIQKSYEEAIGRRYRFFSYGDAMMIL